MGGLSLETSLRLGQTLSPQMIQSLKLLQYSNLQLEQVLKKELQENPILEEAPETEDNEEQKDIIDKEDGVDTGEESSTNDDDGEKIDEADTAPEEKKIEELEWDDYEYESYTPPVGRGSDGDEEKIDLYERVNLTSESLEEHLLKQLREKKLSESHISIAESIIGSIDESGYLSVPISEIAVKHSVPEKEIEEVRHHILYSDPIGIGSKDLRECLLVQIWAKGLSGSLMALILEKHYDLLKKYQLQEIAKQTGHPINDVQSAVRDIGKLEPHPGTLVSETKSATIIPDLIVNKLDNGEFQVILNDGYVPTIRVSREYIDMLKGDRKKSSEVRKYVSEKLNAANWLLRAIEQRKVTMTRVMTAIVQKQREWFEKGPPNLKPLRLQEVADEIGMHISTVCRVSNDKFVQTPYGVYELKQFFSSGVEQEDGSEVSTEKARDLLKELVDGESKTKPLSDQQLVELMKEKGIEVARRTVSKYREQLGILPARLRRVF